MVLRVEYILLISLGVLSFFIFIEKPNSIKSIESNSSKEALFRDFSLVEINKNGIKNELIATEAIKYKDYFEAKYINITHEKIYHLLAQKAIYKKNIVSLEDNITLKKDNEMEFQTESLIYKMREKIAYTEDGFIMDINGSKIRGTHLKYDLNRGEISAEGINASIIIGNI
ncbi:MAG TPA: LPS export ABC transporter periplasmic protein LptC [Campylobacterales bacterium]|nr:LPS export ABC transporter periplasmic protein LptC [Campylobacterales bacterium]HHH50894.1 LPS export ABC transporter periplasmic protein LptC [Campylobacterales bacterium]